MSAENKKNETERAKEHGNSVKEYLEERISLQELKEVEKKQSLTLSK